MSEATSDHETIREWIEARGGVPAVVRQTKGGDEGKGILRVDFPGGAGQDRLAQITWEEFFEEFDRRGLKFLYQEQTKGGGESRFCKFVYKDGSDQ